MAGIEKIRGLASRSPAAKHERDELFDTMDPNGNGIISLAEVDRIVVDMWPDFDHKPALLRAQRAADRDNSGFVERKEFRLLLKYLVYFVELWDKFAEIDVSGDRRLDLAEFTKGISILGIKGLDANAAFKEMDKNNGGFVLFDEFCYFVAEKGCNDADTVSDAMHSIHLSKDRKPVKRVRPAPGAPLDSYWKQEARMQELTLRNDKSKALRHELFSRFDPNGNKILSLAEVEKAVMEVWPEFDHPRSLIRAFNAADRDGSGFVSFREFRLLLEYITFFNGLWEKFDEIDADKDHRLTLEEFKKGLAILPPGDKAIKDPAAVFAKIDRNKGGKILFDEFCAWYGRHVVEKK